MKNMNKDELTEKMKEKGWQISFENVYSFFKIEIQNLHTRIIFRCGENDYSYRIAIQVEGKKEINQDVFESVLAFFRNDKPVIFMFYAKAMSENWQECLEQLFEQATYEKITTNKKQFEATFQVGEEYIVYVTEESKKLINEYLNYFSKVEEVLNENNQNELFFDFYQLDHAEFFVNIDYFLCNIKLSIIHNQFELRIFKSKKCIKKWHITKKEEFKKYLQIYINETKQKQRVRNLFDTPTHFFDKYCVLNEIIDHFKEEIYQVLLTQYDTKEIERISAEFCKTKEKQKRKVGSKNHYTCYFDEKEIVVNRKEKTVKLVKKCV